MTDFWPKNIRPDAIDDEPMVARQAMAGVGDHVRWLRASVKGGYESPIEEKMGGALYAAFRDIIATDRSRVRSQTEIGPYRVDFFVVLGINPVCKWLGIVVECDGEEFHKDKDKDAKRDAWLGREKYQVFRFTGSAIHRDARGCAGHVRRFYDDCQLSLRGRA